MPRPGAPGTAALLRPGVVPQRHGVVLAAGRRLGQRHAVVEPVQRVAVEGHRPGRSSSSSAIAPSSAGRRPAARRARDRRRGRSRRRRRPAGSRAGAARRRRRRGGRSRRPATAPRRRRRDGEERRRDGERGVDLPHGQSDQPERGGTEGRERPPLVPPQRHHGEQRGDGEHDQNGRDSAKPPSEPSAPIAVGDRVSAVHVCHGSANPTQASNRPAPIRTRKAIRAFKWTSTPPGRGRPKPYGRAARSRPLPLTTRTRRSVPIASRNARSWETATIAPG